MAVMGRGRTCPHFFLSSKSQPFRSIASNSKEVISTPTGGISSSLLSSNKLTMYAVKSAANERKAVDLWGATAVGVAINSLGSRKNSWRALATVFFFPLPANFPHLVRFFLLQVHRMRGERYFYPVLFQVFHDLLAYLRADSFGFEVVVDLVEQLEY